jgi:hypothetical protein
LKERFAVSSLEKQAERLTIVDWKKEPRISARSDAPDVGISASALFFNF